MRSKRQQTFAKLTRERMVKERRALKQEKRAAARAARAEGAEPAVHEDADVAEGDPPASDPSL